MKFWAILDKLLLPIMAIAIFYAINEQSKTDKNIIATIVAIFVFMFGMMRLSAKTPSKNQEKNDDNV